jgi:exodeoxyribonuclease V alpha subunit
MQHYILLERNLIYTPITRGKQLVLVIGEAKVLQIAVNRNDTRQLEEVKNY